MIQFLLFVLAVLTSFSSTSSDDHDKCVGLRYFKQRRIDDAVKYLLRSGTENDYDTSIALAASFSMMARRLSTIEGKEEMEIKALRSAVRYFEIAESTSSERIRIKCSENIVHDREQIVRSHGDALSWLGKKVEARELFVRSGLWSLDPNCRSRHQHVEMPNLPYIMKEHAIISRLLPLLTFLQDVTDADTHLTNRMDIESRGWSSEMAGLHRGRRRWYMRFLFVNGKEHEPTYPILKNLVKHVPSLNLKQGQIKLSMMLPGTNVRPHAGPTNGRLRVHCLLHNDMKSHSYIRVGTETKHWNDTENPCFVFRESCEHEVHIDPNATSNRIILIADFANPYLSSFESYLSVFNDDVDVPSVHEEYLQYHNDGDNEL